MRVLKAIIIITTRLHRIHIWNHIRFVYPFPRLFPFRRLLFFFYFLFDFDVMGNK